MKKVLVVLAVVAMCGSTAWAFCSNQTGTDGGYYYTFWSNGGGSVCMTVGGGGNYSLQWSNCGNFTAGKGWSSGGSRTITWSGSCGGQFYGVYGWGNSPCVEYYIGRGGGSGAGSYSTSKGTFTLNINQCNGANITGSGSFQQFNANGSGGSGQNMSEHYNGWSGLGHGISSYNYCVVECEGWNSSGSANVTVGGGSSTTTTTTTTSGGGSTTTTTSGGGSGTIVVRARGTSGQEQIQLYANSATVATWTLSTSMSNYSASTSATNCAVIFTNDASGRDVQVDYVVIQGTTKQAESQSTNTGVYQNSKCGGSYSEWLNCNGYIGF